MIIIWLKALALGTLATAGIYRLFKKFNSTDTFGDWLSRTGWWVWFAVVIAFVFWLMPAGSGYDPGVGSPY